MGWVSAVRRLRASGCGLLVVLLWCAFAPTPVLAQQSQEVQVQANVPEQAPAPVAPIAVEQLPAELQDWVPWVQSAHPDLACPLAKGGRACVWPGSLQVVADADRGTFVLSVHTDRDAVVALPGGPGAWPQRIRDAQDRAVTVLAVGDRPVTTLRPGTHVLRGSLGYTTRPSSLPVPQLVGLIQLSVDGAQVDRPRINSEGLRLGSVATDNPQEEHLELEVSRRIADGVPVVVETVVVLRASGTGREVDFGEVLVSGTRPVSLTANLPARFTPTGTLQVQVRPGTFELRFEAVHAGPVSELSRPAPTAGWPEVETWAVQADERARAIDITGAVGVDPSRTTLPESWRGLPVYQVAVDTPLHLETLRRGDPDPAPNELELLRELWVGFDDGGLTVRDTFRGRMSRGWRLNVLAPTELGHASVNQQDQVVTNTRAGATGVALREADVEVVAESRLPTRSGTLPAVGWDTDVVSLSAHLYLPPGFRLLGTVGVDTAQGSMIERWSLFDLFFVLVLAMATGRLVGWRVGSVALIGLALARHEANAPQWTWAVVLTLVAISRAVQHARARWWMQAARLVALLALALLLVPFGVEHVQAGLFPATTKTGDQLVSNGTDHFESMVSEGRYNGGQRQQTLSENDKMRKKKKKKYLSKQIDPKAVVQTGPGVPTWSWNTALLQWSGPVSQDHSMRLFLLGPTANLVLSLLRVTLLGALALSLAGRWPRRDGAAAGPAAAALLLFSTLAPSDATAAPDPALLAQLEQRLTTEPACAPRCLSVGASTLSVSADTLRMRAEVHAGVDTSWPVPGPAAAWVPERVLLDGRPTGAIARLADGFLHVRIAEGTHIIEVSGPLPGADVVTLALGEVPRSVTWSGQGWAVTGIHADGSTDASISLTRVLGGSAAALSTENLAPWLEVHRQLDLGLPWRVRTTVRRVGPTDSPVTLTVPLLPGEAVTEGGMQATGGKVAVSLDRDEQRVGWLSTLPATAELVLTAPTSVPWTEVWSLSCSPMFACSTDGPAPLTHVDAERTWSPQWRVWPGEEVRVAVTRPEGVQGQTTTIDRAELKWEPGRRQLLAELALEVRSSQGGRQAMRLPPGAQLQSVSINGAGRPLQLQEGRTLQLPLAPGAQRVLIRWQQARPTGIANRLPLVELGGPAVNAKVTVQQPRDRWIVALFGPRWGPVPLMWIYVFAVLLLAPLLARIRHSPLAGWQWLLLGMGMTQVWVLAPALVAGWFFALEWRRVHPPQDRRVFHLVQVLLIGLTVAALASLYLAIHAGLLWQPDLQVAGAGSSDHQLVWLTDQLSGAMPQPMVVSLPMWTWRVVMLLWSLWLAASLVRWLPWAFAAWTDGGWIRRSTPTEETTVSSTP